VLPSFSVRETHYGERFENGKVADQNINRPSGEGRWS
jgi:hypothetical protein